MALPRLSFDKNGRTCRSFRSCLRCHLARPSAQPLWAPKVAQNCWSWRLSSSTAAIPAAAMPPQNPLRKTQRFRDCPGNEVRSRTLSLARSPFREWFFVKRDRHKGLRSRGGQLDPLCNKHGCLPSSFLKYRANSGLVPWYAYWTCDAAQRL
jgi:hypothetical protein